MCTGDWSGDEMEDPLIQSAGMFAAKERFFYVVCLDFSCWNISLQFYKKEIKAKLVEV